MSSIKAPTSIFVDVQLYGGTYLAKALGKRASCTGGPNFAAQRCAAKVLGCDEDLVLLTEIRHGLRYLCRKVETQMPTTEPAAAEDSGVVKWHYLPEMPDAEVAVLVAVWDCADATEGYTDGENWFFQGGMLIDSTVYAWAHLPDCPPLPAAAERRAS